MDKRRGFTIIELIVVIAIIAVLASIVLVNVTDYINKSKNSAIKANMSTILTNGTVWYYELGDYGSHSYNGATAATFCNGVLVTNPKASIDNAYGSGSGFICRTKSTNDAWCACVKILTTSAESGTLCVDSTGFKGVSITVCTNRCAVAGVPMGSTSNGACINN